MELEIHLSNLIFTKIDYTYLYSIFDLFTNVNPTGLGYKKYCWFHLSLVDYSDNQPQTTVLLILVQKYTCYILCNKLD